MVSEVSRGNFECILAFLKIKVCGVCKKSVPLVSLVIFTLNFNDFSFFLSKTIFQFFWCVSLSKVDNLLSNF